VNLVKWHVLGDTEINSTDDEVRYSRAYITELASQFREEARKPGFNFTILKYCPQKFWYLCFKKTYFVPQMIMASFFKIIDIFCRRSVKIAELKI
jgi:hypothetical protein